MLTGLLVAVAVLAGTGIATWQAVRAIQAGAAIQSKRVSSIVQRQDARRAATAERAARQAEATQRQRAEASEEESNLRLDGGCSLRFRGWRVGNLGPLEANLRDIFRRPARKTREAGNGIICFLSVIKMNELWRTFSVPIRSLPGAPTAGI